MTIDLDALEALEKKATPGPWRLIGNQGAALWAGNSIIGSPMNGRKIMALARRDSELIMEYRNALHELIRLARIGQRAERDAKETKCST